MIEGWQTEQSCWEVFFAGCGLARRLTERGMLTGLTRHLGADTAEELIRLAAEQKRIEERLNRIPRRPARTAGTSRRTRR
ncbi:hypothetical protein OIE13_34630 [Streptosporangium sp. NBC_01810]|uniref:hypothetical protein n=1 Tax=Streptosporangium sp. NBC_01810 TaxID=2975951 RepID=UPI002DDC18FF|nr:hypothetical protein [Streptosporangium sp. NBC_01810]WSA25978.1 hypothetical protein OIE13_34630 [Streptosporangium sp. NBC_01810]